MVVSVLGYRLEALRGRLERWLLGARAKRYELLAVVKLAKLLHPEEVRLLRSRKCPWCGRHFTTYSGLKLHLKSRGKCGWQLWDLENHVLEVYAELKQKLEEVKHRKGGNYKLANSEGIVYKFKHITEAATFYVNHVLKVAQHG